ncbi:MAG TPA: DUF4349 domain-containing protein [Solirubrobacterales bacterium]|nr:DUF4349 domain-containing protein [Solirubrobacterales bacterium]
MKLREHEMPLDPEVERELEEIDRALGGEPVDSDLDALAELARALREERVSAEPRFAAELDQRVAEGFPRAGRLDQLRRRLTAVPPRRILAPAGAAATLLVVVGVAISQSGEIGGGNGNGGISPQPAPDQPVGVSPARPSGAGAEPAGGAPAERDAQATFLRDKRAASAANVPLARRRIARRVDLALSTSPERFRDAADGVLDVVRDHRGFVVRSNVSGGDPDAPRSQLGHGSFTLRIPVGELGAALGDLSDLGHVVSRTDGTQDITSRFVSVKKRIAALEKARQNLLRQLADATTVTEQESIRRRLEIVESQLSAAREDLGSAQRRVHLVPVSVTIDADRALADGDGGDGWGLGDAVDDAGKVLTVTAGVLLVSAAVLGPLAILAVLIWLGVRALTRLRRERALDQI